MDSKTVVPYGYPGFESLSLRHISSITYCNIQIFIFFQNNVPRFVPQLGAPIRTDFIQKVAAVNFSPVFLLALLPGTPAPHRSNP